MIPFNLRNKILWTCLPPLLALSLLNGSDFIEKAIPPLMAQGFEGSSPRRLPTPNEVVPKEGTRNPCREAFFQYGLPLKKIAKYVRGGTNVSEIMALDADDCLVPQRRIALVKLLTKLLNEHSNQALLLLPSDGANAEKNMANAALARGIADAIVTTQGKSLTTVRISLPEAGKTLTGDDLLRAIANQFWTTKPSLIISALNPTEDAAATSLANDFAIPVVLVGPPPPQDSDSSKKTKSKRIFRIFPDQAHLAATLAKTACSRGIKKLGILRPSTAESGAFAKSFESAFKLCGGLIATGGTYTTASFQSVDLAIKEIAPALTPTPGKSGGFAAKSGLLILDDARVARHAAKVAKLNGLTSTTLMGHHRWRSATIVEPFDPAFEQAFFVDYLGLNQSAGGSLPQFPDPQATWQAIWLATGRRAGQLASATFQAGSGYPRKNLHRIMATMPAPQDGFFESRTFFAANLEAWWPAFVFTITQGNLQVNTMAPSDGVLNAVPGSSSPPQH